MPDTKLFQAFLRHIVASCVDIDHIYNLVTMVIN